MTADVAVPVVGGIAETALLVTLACKRVARTHPVFFCYQAFCMLEGFAGSAVQTWCPRQSLHFWIVDAITDTLFACFVLAEVGRNLLRRNRKSSAGWPLVLLLGLLTVLLLHALSPWSVPSRFPFVRQLSVDTLHITAVFLFTAFLTLVLWSSLRRLHWPDRELRIASGLGLTAFVCLVVAILHSYAFSWSPSDHWIDFLVPLCYLGVVLYWTSYFAFEDGGKAPVELCGEELVRAGGRADPKRTRRMKFIVPVRRTESR